MESPFRADVLRGKAALLTGGGSGIGFEIATQLARHGAQVAIMGRRRVVLDKAVAALRSEGLNAVGFDGDVRKQEDAARVVAATVAHFGKLDILVNGAAGNFLASPEDLKPKGFRTVLDIDTVGTYTMCYEALKYLKKGGPGRSPSSGGLIINISATLQYTAAWYQIHLSAAKAGVDSITRSLALEWGTDYDIRVNGIAPGPIQDTPGMRKLAPEEMDRGKREMMPLFKLGEKWDIAMAALYLASDADSEMLAYWRRHRDMYAPGVPEGQEAKEERDLWRMKREREREEYRRRQANGTDIDLDATYPAGSWEEYIQRIRRQKRASARGKEVIDVDDD